MDEELSTSLIQEEQRTGMLRLITPEILRTLVWA